MPVRRRVRHLNRLATPMVCLLALAVVLLLVGLTLQLRGLQDAANVAQLVSVLLAVPPLLVPLVTRLRPPKEAGKTTPGVDETGPLRVTAEVMDVEALARRSDGRLVPVDGHSLQIYVEATEGTVLLRRLRPVVVSQEPVHATLVPKPTMGVLEPRPFELLLDPGVPEVRPRVGGVDFPFSVSPSDPEVLKVTVRLRRDQVAWYLLLDWTQHGRSGTHSITAAGQPFLTVGSEGLGKAPR
ncbi:hypothetical protein ACIBJE_22700 [Micromonospora sp. NPDC050187]|uniref:hypothetical protein n=1 Tax=Micromonospora sp. NPDC050187 TaxID=3364277 RepID=UPI0037AC8514